VVEELLWFVKGRTDARELQARARPAAAIPSPVPSLARHVRPLPSSSLPFNPPPNPQC